MRSTPTVVLTRGIEMTPGIAENHAGLAALSTNSRHTVVPDAGHEIHLFAPTVVIQAIQDVIAAVQTKGRLALSHDLLNAVDHLVYATPDLQLGICNRSRVQCHLPEARFTGLNVRVARIHSGK